MLALFQKSRPRTRPAAAPDPTRTALERALAVKDHPRARALLVELQERDPREPRWPHKLGELLATTGQPKEAAQAYRKAAALYLSRGFEARAHAMTRLARSLSEKSAPLQASHPSLVPDADRSLHAPIRIVFSGR